MIKDFKNKKVTVFGLGLHGGGVGTVKFLVKQGAKVVVTDIKNKEELAESLEKLKGLKNVEYILGQHRSEDFIKTDMVIKTPAAPWSNKHIRLALEHKIPVEMDSSLFFKFCPLPIIGVTGTKGKTTICEIIYAILKSAGRKPIRVGVGQRSVLDKLELLEEDSIVIFELSSWRLSALKNIKKSPQIAVFKNILPDHLNYYKSLDDYITDKKNIFLHQKPEDWLVINQDDERVVEITKESQSKGFRFSEFPISDSRGVFVENEAIYLNDGNDIRKIVDLEELKIKGKHNVSNILAAISVCYLKGVKLEKIKKGLLEFQGVAHRLELVSEKGGIKFYNDTAATIPEAAVAGINSFLEPVVLIAGGNNKGGLNFSEFGETVANKIKDIVFLKGNATADMITAIKKYLPEEKQEKDFEIVDSMEKAVALAFQKAEKGDIVLLSPGAASFGLFLNEFDRGEKFKKAVEGLEI